MARDGSGIYSVPGGTLATTATTIDSAAYNAFLADLVADLNAARPVSAGGTGVTSYAALKTALSLVLGTDVQAWSAKLDTLAALASVANLVAEAGLTGAANKLDYYTGSGAKALTDLTAAGRAILDDADAAAQRATLGLVIGTNVQAFAQALADISGLSPSNDDVLQRKSGAWVNRTLAQLAADLGVGGWTQIGTATSVNSGTSVVIGSIPSGYRALKLRLNRISIDDAPGSPLSLELSSNAGSNYGSKATISGSLSTSSQVWTGTVLIDAAGDTGIPKTITPCVKNGSSGSAGAAGYQTGFIDDATTGVINTMRIGTVAGTDDFDGSGTTTLWGMK